MNRAVSRRRFLTGSGVATIGVLAGCVGQSSTDGNLQVPSPNVPGDMLSEGGWEMIAEREERVFEEEYLAGIVSVSANQHTLIYEDQQLRNTIKERTLGNIDTTLKTFFATKVDINPGLSSLPLGLGTDEIVAEVKSNAKSSFEDQLGEAGLSNVSETGTSTLVIDTGETADLVRYSASYRYDSIPVPVPNADDIIIPSDELHISGVLAVWPHGESVLVAGGAYPSEDFEESAGTDVNEAISVTVSIDLGLQPMMYRREILELIQSTK